MNPQELYQKAWQALRRRDAKQAIALSQQLNAQFPKFAEGWRLSSLIAGTTRNHKVAVDLARKAVDIEPTSPVFLTQLAQSLVNAGEPQEALAVVDQTMALKPKDAHIYDALGNILSLHGDQERALSLFRKATEKEPSNPKFLFNLATALRFHGEFDAAERAYNKVISARPDDFEAHKNRSDLKRQTREKNHIEELKEALQNRSKNWQGEMQLCYALAKELEDIEDYDQSFEYLKRGSDLRRSHMKYDVNQDVETMATIRESFSVDLFSRSTVGFENAEPIFIVGLPRTGSTLVERILDSHSEVSSEGELQNFAVQLTKVTREAGANSPQGRFDLINASTTIDFRTLGERYIESTRPRTGHSSYFIDKMPLNFLYVGLVHLALPNAKIIHVRRDPMDACYAIYKTLFRDAYPYSYDLDDLAKYYVAYRELMEHWHRALPRRVFDLLYEDLVDHQEEVTRRLLEHCQLPFEQACLDFYKHKGSSTTASASQIRQPIYKSSVGKWRHYEKHLAKLGYNLSTAGLLLTRGSSR